MRDRAEKIEAQARKALLSGDAATALALFEEALTFSPENAASIQVILGALRTEEAEIMGLHLYLPSDVVNPEVLLALVDDTFELGEREAAIGDIRPGDVVLEMGAGLGTVTLALSLLFPDTPVCAVEANPRLEEVLRRNITQNNVGVEIIGALAALEDGEADFHIAPNFVSSSMVLKRQDSSTLRRPTVDVRRLVQERQPTILIMDIEGTEIDLLWELDLSGIRRIVVEFHPGISTDSVITETIAHLIEQGFDLNLRHSDGQVVAFDRRVPASTNTEVLS